MQSKELQNWQDKQALDRFRIISPLLDESLDRDKKIQLRKDIASNNNISERSLRRYEASYQADGFAGLKPANRAQRRSKNLPENFEFLVEEAILLKREIPTRSVAQIIKILELEHHVPHGVLKRSTLQRHLYNAGFGKRQMQMYNDARKSSSKRFCKPHRMMLVQADIKYGCYLPIGKNHAMVRTYLSSVIDDHSRYLLFSRFYDNQEESVVEDTFHTAILRHGKFDCAYFDHGSQYVAKQLKQSLAILGITIRYAPVRSGKSKGVIEKFHQVVDKFLVEAEAHKIKTLDELNRYWEIYCEEYYHQDPHDGIAEYYQSQGLPIPAEGITPEQEWLCDSRPLTYFDAGIVAEAFLHHETRRVDKGACISFRGRKYETKTSLIGCIVEISYDPNAPQTITVKYPGVEPFTAEPVKIGAFCDKNPALPLSMQDVRPENSRLLAALEKKHEDRSARRADAISFSSFRKDGGQHV